MTAEQTPAEVLLSKRILLVTGKGGVGKTTVVAALAKCAAASGKRTLALDVERSFDTTSQLLELLGGGSSFQIDEPVSVGPSLSCARLSSAAGQTQFLLEQLPFQWLAKAAMRSKYLQRFLRMAPGFQELGILYRCMPYLRQREPNGSFTYEQILIDLPATGHALALTSIPGPMLDVFESGPIADGIREAQSYYNDPEQAGALVVSLPEPLVIAETLELIEGLERDEVGVTGVIVNQLPDSPWDADARERLSALFARSVESEGPMLGAWSLQRIADGYDALDDLREKVSQRDTPLQVVTIPEHEATSPKDRVEATLARLSEGQAND